MSVKYHHPAEFTLAEIAWIVDGAYAEDLGEALGGKTVAAARQRWTRVQRAGGMTMAEADRFATRLGYHPANLWDDWFSRCADLDDRHEEWREHLRRKRADRRRGRIRTPRPTVAARRQADERIEWVKWVDRRDRARSLAEELAAR